MSFTQDTQSSSLSETYLRYFHRANTVNSETDIELDDHKLLDSIGFLEQEDDKFHTIEEKIVASTGTIVGILHRLVNSSEVAVDAPEVLSKLLRPNFLNALFRHRQVLVLQVPLPDTPEFVVDWAGLVLFKLSEAVLYFSGPRALEHNCKRLPWSDIREFKMSPRKYTRAVSQLPPTWSEIHSCFDLSGISEAGRRLAIYLLFGVYILSPHLTKSKVEGSNDLFVFKESLYGYLKRAGSIEPPEKQTLLIVSTGPREHIFKSQYSLLLVLFSSLDLDMDNIGSTPKMSFHPSVTDGVMTLIEHFLLNDQKHILIDTLTEEQYLLFRWNNFILWLWKVWETGLYWHERILQITATWLYHFVITDSDLNEALQSKSCSSCVAEILLTLIIDLSSSHETNQTVRAVLFKASWAFCFLFEKDKSLLNEMTLQKAFQIFLRLQITVGYDLLDMSIRDLAVQFAVETASDLVMTTDDVTQIVVNVIQQVKDICARNCRTDPDETVLMTYLPILILVSHYNREKLSHIVNPLISSQLASVVEDSRWSSTVQLNALLLLSYSKIDGAFYCRLFSIMLRRTRSRDVQYAVVLATCVDNVGPILSNLDTCVLLELWFYLVDTFLMYSDSELTQDLSPIWHTIACALSQLISQTSLARSNNHFSPAESPEHTPLTQSHPVDPAWSSSPWTEVLRRNLVLRNQSPGARALLQQLREEAMAENNQVSKHVFTRRLNVVYIRGKAQLISIIE